MEIIYALETRQTNKSVQSVSYKMDDDGKQLSKSYSQSSLLKLTFSVTLSCFLAGYNNGLTNSSLLNVEKAVNWGQGPWLFSITCNGAFAIGGAIGSALSGELASKYGRIKVIIFLDLICIVGSITVTPKQTCVPFYTTFITGRFINGIAAGMEVVIPLLLINETVPKEIRGKMGSIIQFQITLGIFVAYVLCIMLPVYEFNDPTNNLWILVYGFAIVPSLIQLYLLRFVYPGESPVWLAGVNRMNEAENSLNLFYGKKNRSFIQNKVNELKFNEEQKEMSRQPSYTDVISIKKYSKPLIVGCVLSALQQFSGINMFIFYSSQIYQDTQGHKNFANIFTAGLGLVNSVAVLLCLGFIEKYGRKILFIQGFIGMGVSHLVLFLFKMMELPAAANLPFILTYIVFFESSIGPVLLIYCGETLSDRGVGLALAVNWIGTLIILVGFSVYQYYVGLEFAFLTFAGICFFGCLFVIVYVKETKGKSREEVEWLLLN